MNIEIWKNTYTQLIATLGVMLLITQTGIMIGWTSPNMARLTQVNSTIPFTLSEASWLASCINIGRLVSIILIPVFIELTGSKKSVLYSYIPVSLSWMLTMMAKSTTVLYIARFLCGISYGLAYGCCGIYIGEIATSTHRGTLIAIATVGWPLGIIVGTAGETSLPVVVSSGIYLALCFFGILLFAWLPDSPYKLVKNKDLIKARESLMWYRGHDDIEQEMNEIVEYVEATTIRVTVVEKIKQLSSPPIRNAVILVTLIYTYPQLYGIFNIIFYMQIILTNGKSFLIEPSEAVLYTTIALLVSAIVSINLIDKLGRRILLVVSSAVMTTAFSGLGIHFYLVNNAIVDPVNIQGLLIASIIILLVAFTVGFVPAMNALLGEMFPASIKSTAATVATCTTALVGFVTTKAYQPLIDSIGEMYVFSIYAAITALVIPTVLFWLPETKGKSLQDIQIVLNKK